MSKLCRAFLILSLLLLAVSVILLFRATWPCSMILLVFALLNGARRGFSYVQGAFGSARFALDEELKRRGMIDE